MEALAHDLHRKETIHPELPIVQTNLYDLIEAIHDEVELDEDWLVTEIVFDLIDSGNMKFLVARILNH